LHTAKPLQCHGQEDTGIGALSAAAEDVLYVGKIYALYSYVQCIVHGLFLYCMYEHMSTTAALKVVSRRYMARVCFH